MVKAVANGKLKITSINSLHGPGGKPYFTASALVSHGCPRPSSQIRCAASGSNRW
jgi:hypothetical protein